MAWNPSPEVAVARDAAAALAKVHGQGVDRCIVLYTTDDGRIGYASFGRDRKLCAEARKIADAAYDAAIAKYEEIA